MARFSAAIEVSGDPGAVWDRVVDWPAHGRWVPLTRVRLLTPSGAGVGARFVGRTGIGPLAFDDVLEVVEWQPPTATAAGRCRVVRQGRLLHGGAWFTVSGVRPGFSLLDWSEDIEIVPVRLTRPFGPLLSVGGRRGLAAVLRRIARELAADPRPRAVPGRDDGR